MEHVELSVFSLPGLIPGCFKQHYARILRRSFLGVDGLTVKRGLKMMNYRIY